MNEKLKAWLDESGKYLPPFLRDFHNQKDVFKTIHQKIAVEKHRYCKNVDWVTGQCYVIDIFLWYMARKGFTLQKSRQRLEFEDINEDIKQIEQQKIKETLSLIEEGKF